MPGIYTSSRCNTQGSGSDYWILVGTNSTGILSGDFVQVDGGAAVAVWCPLQFSDASCAEKARFRVSTLLKVLTLAL